LCSTPATSAERTSSRPRALHVAPKREPVAIAGAARVTMP
jgi:hypothetical protein